MGDPLKVVILAAGQQGLAKDGAPRALQPLGDRAIIDYVLGWAEQFAVPADTVLIVGEQQEALRQHVGPDYVYCLQAQRLGTGHALLQVMPELSDYAGDLLILYGDTPLFRLSSLRGMLLRHRIKGADLTLFSCVSGQDLPYGRVLRAADGAITGVIEEAEADASQRAIRELNLGAYVAKAQPLFEALQQVGRHACCAYPLTAVVDRLAAAGRRVCAYRTVDQDEVLGINTPQDLAAAELILKKRILRPSRIQEENIIRFGTGGWRGVIGEAFTLHNVRRLCQAIAQLILHKGQEEQGVLIGYDRRFLSDTAAQAAAEVFAGNDIAVGLLREAAPTPLITYATVAHGAAYGLAFTASHNPPEWNGLKVFRDDGALLLDDETREIEQVANALPNDQIVKIELPIAIEAGRAKAIDYTNEYVDVVESFVDMEAIRGAGLRVLVDPMYGVGEVTINIVLTEARCRVTTIHGRHDPLFGGRSPAPNLDALSLLIHDMKEGQYDLGLATDGDADRIAIVDERGQYIAVNDLLVLLYWYLHELRSQSGAVVRNLATTHMLDRLARQFGEACLEVPVGFKHIASGMVDSDAILGGESSGGLTIRGHILGKDGILAAALIVEMLAKTGKKVSELLGGIYGQIGRLYSVERNLPATPEMKALFPTMLRQKTVSELAGLPVREMRTFDGHKLVFGGDQWVLLRFSGTEPLLRIFGEGDSPERALALVDAAQALLPM